MKTVSIGRITPMRLRIHHRTEYRYSHPVRESENQLRLTPLSGRWQRCESSFISVLPATHLAHYPDLHGNTVHYFSLPEEHDYLVIDSRCTVITSESKVDYQNLPYGFLHKELGDNLKHTGLHPYLNNSQFIEVTPAIWREALDIQDKSEDVFETSYALMAFINENYQYLPGSTHVSTHANEVIEGKAGVCQDFAHAMISYCRALQIPARYVSGYFYDPTHDHHLKGSRTSHAWVEVYIKDYGWIGLDPTNLKVTDHTYVTTAIGRDYMDVAPIIGTFRGHARSSMDVSVTVEQLTVE
ncbi:transglutaminase family protein [Rubritalea halochordaticola]